MVKNFEYQIVTVKHREADLYFVGKVPKFITANGSALLNNFLNFKSSQTQECPYKKLSALVAKDTSNKFIVVRSKDSFKKDECEEKIFKFQMNLISKFGEDCLLNDVIINPEKYICICGQSVHTQFKEAHDEKYCGAKNVYSFDSAIDIN